MRYQGHNSIGSIKGRRRGDQYLDLYHGATKLAGPLVCIQCQAVLHGDRWQWRESPPQATPTLCPACRRIRDRQAAYWLRIEGLPPSLRSELLATMHRVAAAERSDHPLERLMLVHETAAAVEVATTGRQLARRLLAAILRTWRHHLLVQHDPERSLLRWRSG